MKNNEQPQIITEEDVGDFVAMLQKDAVKEMNDKFNPLNESTEDA